VAMVQRGLSMSQTTNGNVVGDPLCEIRPQLGLLCVLLCACPFSILATT
jgi:hypothetical protein